MSSTVPPQGPAEGPEFLEMGHGRPLAAKPRRSGRQSGLIVGGLVVGAVAVGAAGYGAYWFLASGPQPAQALPASTLAYASIDLDPSGKQLLAARETLEKFPAWRNEGISSQSDLRQWLFEEIQGSGACAGLDYADDIEPWLGERAAVAVLGDVDEPTPVLVVQVTDAGKAEDGLEKLLSCASNGAGADEGAGDGGEPAAGWAINGDWAVIAETDGIAESAGNDAQDKSLAEDDAYSSWTGRLGDPGILSVYAAPEAGAAAATLLADVANPLGLALGDGDGVLSPEDSQLPDETMKGLEDFQGMAATVRFDDGGLELEVATAAGDDVEALYGTDRGDDVLATLPNDTAAALGVGFADGWFTTLLDGVAGSAGGERTAEELITEAESATGLELPEDVETLLGQSATLALGGDFDAETFSDSADGSDVPVGVMINGDPDGIEEVLDKLRPQFGDEASVLDTDSTGDTVVIGPSADYREQLVDGGDLGDSDVFGDVVREAADASALFFVNFDAGDNWLAEAVREGLDDDEFADNLEPLSALGLSTWRQDDAAHAVLRITTN